MFIEHMQEQEMTNPLKEYVKYREHMVALLKIDRIQQVLGRPMFAFLTQPNKEAHYKIIKQIEWAVMHEHIDDDEAFIFVKLVDLSLKLYESLSHPRVADHMLADIAAKRISESFTLKK